jgi:AhpD family alkylhydroperoxidase
MKDLNYKMKLPKVDVNSADEQRKPVIEDVIEKNGRLPNMYAYMINSPGVLETYLYGYERFRKESGFTPPEQEVIFLTISYENECEYCMAAHSMIADHMSKVPAEVTDAIRDGRQIKDMVFAHPLYAESLNNLFMKLEDES